MTHGDHVRMRLPPVGDSPQRGGPWPQSSAQLAPLLGAALAILAGSAALAFENLASVERVPTPEMRPPEYLEPNTDPVFGTRFVRVTEPGREILPRIYCERNFCRHRYSSTQAWNADQTLLMIPKGCPGICFLDGQSYRPLFQRRPSGVCEWHPLDAERMICVSETEIYSWSVRSDKRTTIFAPKDYRGLRFGPGKNNLARDGNRLVVRANTKSGALVAFAYDIQTATKYPDIDLARLDGVNSYCTISPSGQHTFCFQRLPDQMNSAYVYNLNAEQVQHWSEHHRPGHGDMTIDHDGSDVYVGISKSEPDKYQVIKRRLSDGTVIALTPRGPAQHASIRNINRPGWVFLTYGGTYERAVQRGQFPLYGEIVALRIDGSGEVRRIAHHRSSEQDYLSEAHASPSPDGSQVIWASDWGRPGGPVSAYVARLSWPDAVAERR